jgi:uncharacterized protein DUF3800
MDVFFVDDASQSKPSRKPMGPLIGIGGVHVPGERVGDLERALGALCSSAGFPQGQEFKWSPGRGDWMWKGLVDDARKKFFMEALAIAATHGSHCIVVIEDTTHLTATAPGIDHILDATTLFLERANTELSAARTFGLVVVDRPSGGAAEDARYLGSCFEALRTGTKYVKPDRIAINVLSTSSHLVRLLQLADVVVSCAVSFVAGEDRYSPPIFEALLPMFHRSWVGIGGVGLKIHPDHNYVNLYHWLLGDQEFKKGRFVHILPIASRPFADSDRVWR